MKTIHDGELVSLIRKYLVSGVMENGVVSPTKVGTPQGGNLSPLLSNIMLNELDKELEKRGLRFTRYADDCIIVVQRQKLQNGACRRLSGRKHGSCALRRGRAAQKFWRNNGRNCQNRAEHDEMAGAHGTCTQKSAASA